MNSKLYETACTKCLRRIFTEKYAEKKICSICQVKNFVETTGSKQLLKRIKEANENE